MDTKYQQNNINNNFGPINGTIQNQTIYQPATGQSEQPKEQRGEATPFHLNTKKCSKVDLIRLLYAIDQLEMVVDKNGDPITLNDFVVPMGKLFNVDLQDYWNNLSGAKSSGVREQSQTKIFDDLKRAFQKNYLEKQ